MSPPETPPPSFRLWVEAFLLSAFCSVAFLLVYGRPSYASNDDMGMDMIAAGVMVTSEPSALLVFIHPLYGWVLSSLYQVLPNIAWHGVLLLLLTALACAALYGALVRIRRDALFRVFMALLVAATTGYCMTNVQFTTVSGLCVMAGILLGASQWLLPTSQRSLRYAEFILATGLIICGALLRAESAYMAAMLSIPVVFAVTWHQSASWRGALLWMAILVAAVVSCAFSADLWYRSPGWSRWKLLNEAKSEVIDTHRVAWNEKTAPIFARHGFTREDYDMLYTWQYQDQRHFSPEKLAEVVDGVLSTVGDQSDAASNSSNIVAKLIEKIRSSIQLQPVYIAAAAGLLLTTAFGKRRIAGFLVVVFATFLLLLYLDGIVNRLPLRVQAIGAFSMGWGTLMLLALPQRQTETVLTAQRSRLLSGLALTLLAWAMLDFHLYCRVWTDFASQNASTWQKKVEAWQQHLPADAILYNAGGAIALDSYSPLRPLSSLPELKVVSAGWLNQSPLDHSHLIQHGLDPENLFPSLARQPNVFLVLAADEKTSKQSANALAAYCRLRHQLKLQLAPAPHLPGLLKMSFEPIPAP